MKITYIFTLAIMLLAASTTTYAQSVAEEVQTTVTTEKLTTKVRGITCATDVKTIAANVEKLDGVSACTPTKTGATTTYEIAYNPALVTEEEIKAAIQDTPGCENPNDRPYTIRQ